MLTLIAISFFSFAIKDSDGGRISAKVRANSVIVARDQARIDACFGHRPSSQRSIRSSSELHVNEMKIIEPRARRYYPADKGQRQLSRKLLRKRRPNALWEARITSDDDDDRIGVTHRRRMIRESILSTSFARSRPRNSRRHCSLRFAEFPQMTRVRIAVALLAHFRGLR